MIGNAKILSRRQGSIFRKKGKLKKLTWSEKKGNVQFYLKISKINEKVNIFFILPKTLTSHFDVALNMRVKGLHSVYGCFRETIQCLRLSQNSF